MRFSHLKGLIAAPFTPMNADGAVNTSLIPAYYSFLKHNGITGAFICGSTGEGASLTVKEKMQVADAWASCTRNDSSFHTMMLLGGTSLKECTELARHAYSIGIDAVSFTAPYYFKPGTVALLADCCREVAAAVPEMPFYYYHIPVLTGVNFPMIQLLQLLDGTCPNFAGIKYTHEDFMDFQSCLHYKNNQYDMLWGRDENLLPSLSIGAKGAVGSTYNYAAPLYHDIIAAFEKGDLALATRLQQQSIDMIRLLGKYGGIGVGKAFMKAVGMDCGSFRLPVPEMTEVQQIAFKNDLEAVGFAAYCSTAPEFVNI